MNLLQPELPVLSGFVLVVILWLLTFFVMVPLHVRLGTEGFQPQLVDALVRWNWLCTIAWTTRALICASYFR